MAGDANQKITQDNLSERCMSIHNYIKLLEDTIDRLDQDTEVLQNRKQRLRSAMLGVHQVHNINSECLHIRSLRMEDDHLNDEPYKQLIQVSSSHPSQPYFLFRAKHGNCFMLLNNLIS
uniref:Uncharacterized protein n=1 Tax=Cacopsylla melanoneura TaxID=428564 RepID=A0A8D9AML6_9HEMI